MLSLTDKERETVLILFKDFTAYYNANSISKVLGISRIGALKLFRRMEEAGIVRSQKIGKSIIYKLKLDDDYVKKLVAFLLADEANGFKRWKEEFKQLLKKDRIVMLFGSAVMNYQKANDIDLLIAATNSDREEIAKVLKERGEILPKKLHVIKITRDELESNIKRKEEPILDIVKTGIVLYGQDAYVEVLKNVTGN